MKKYKLLLLVLLMLISTDVYAYNWCKGGIGANSYDICDRQTNPYLSSDEWGVGMSYTNNRTACGTLLNQCPRTMRAMIDSDMFKNNKEISAGLKEFIYHDEQMFIVNAAKSYENVNTFYTNMYLINNDSYADLFNQNVVVTRREYNVEDNPDSGTFTVVRIEIPIIGENGKIVNKNYIIYTEEDTSTYKDVRVNNYIQFVNAFRKDPSEWPGYISIKPTRGLNGATAAGLYIQGESCSGCTVFGIKPETPQIIINEDPCSGTQEMKKIIEDYLIKALHIIAPILLFVLTTLDLVKGVAANDGKGLNKALTTFTKRALVCILLFFAGDIVNILLDLAGVERCEVVDTGDLVEYVKIEDNPYYDEINGFVD